MGRAVGPGLTAARTGAPRALNIVVAVGATAVCHSRSLNSCAPVTCRRRCVEDVPPLMEVPAGRSERQVGQGKAVGDLPNQELSHQMQMAVVPGRR